MKNKKTLLIALMCAALVFAGAAGGYLALTYEKNKPAKPLTTETTAAVQNGNEQESVPETTANPAPDFTVDDLEGNAVSLSELKGKPAVICVWSTQGDDCREELEYLNSLSAEYENRANFLAVNIADSDKDYIISVKTYLLEYGFNLPVYLDSSSQLKKAYKIKKFPTLIFIDSAGNVYEQYTGLMSEGMIRGRIEKLIG